MEENCFAASMEPLRPVANMLRSLSMLPPISDLAETLACATVSVKEKPPMRGFFRWAFLNPSPIVLVTPVVKEGASSPGSPTTIKGSDFKVNGLTQSQKWLVGFDLSREVVEWEQGDKVWDGDDGDFLYLLGVLPSDLALDWELDSVKDMDSSLIILEAIEEEYHRGG